MLYGLHPRCLGNFARVNAGLKSIFLFLNWLTKRHLQLRLERRMRDLFKGWIIGIVQNRSVYQSSSLKTRSSKNYLGTSLKLIKVSIWQKLRSTTEVQYTSQEPFAAVVGGSRHFETIISTTTFIWKFWWDISYHCWTHTSARRFERTERIGKKTYLANIEYKWYKGGSLLLWLPWDDSYLLLRIQ